MTQGKIFYRNSLSFIAATGLLLGACGPKINSSGDSIIGDRGGDEGFNPNNEMISVNVGLSDQFGLSLSGGQAASSYTMALGGCASGWSINPITDQDPQINIYKFDRGCQVRLLSFTVAGHTYQAENAGNATWAEGDSNTFVRSGNSSDKLTVSVVNQLSSPTDDGDQVLFTFSEYGSGAAGNASDTSYDGITLAVSGIVAPAFTIASIELKDITPGGYGVFDIQLNCNNGFVAASGGGWASCAGVSLGDVTYSLVADQDPDDMDYDHVKSIHGDGTEVDSGLQNSSGFKIEGINGTGLMHDTDKMILILSNNNESFRYYPINVTTLSYP